MHESLSYTTLSLSCLMVLNVPYKLLNVNSIKPNVFVVTSIRCSTLCAQQFLQNVYDNRHTKLYMPTSTGLSLITTDLKVKKKKKHSQPLILHAFYKNITTKTFIFFQGPLPYITKLKSPS